MKLFKTTTPESATHLARELDRARPKHDEEWLEPYELPTEDELCTIILRGRSDADSSRETARKIINLLKGER